jgi:biopolymer transport protein ExbD
MKFPRNARIFRGQLDAAPFIAVFFLLVIFVMLGSLSYTPGVRVNLPVSDELPGVIGPAIAIVVTTNGQFYFRNKLIGESELKSELRESVRSSSAPLTLVVKADRAVRHETMMHVRSLARETGIRDILEATQPRVFRKASSNTSGQP